MKPELGAQLPAWQWDFDIVELRDWAQGVEGLGFEWVGMTDHVFYAYETPTRDVGKYAGGTIQHETLTFLAWLAGQTQEVQLTTSVLVLPQRQASLVAKQAAEIDILSEGRLRLGVGVGWQEAEFDGLGKRFGDRGRRCDDDIAVLRACWGPEPLDISTGSESIDQLSMIPKPFTPGGPPVLYGGVSAPGIDRAARLCDGWIAMTRFEADGAKQLVDQMHTALALHGRDPETFPLQATVAASDDAGELHRVFETYLEAGFTRLGLHLPGIHDLDKPPARQTVDEALEQLRRIREDVWLPLVG